MLLVGVLLFYGPAWWIFSETAPVYRRLLAEGLEWSSTVRGKPIEARLSGAEIVFRTRERPFLEGTVTTTAVDSGVPLLIALILATPGLFLIPRVNRLAAGILLMAATHVAFLAVKTEVTYLAADHPWAGPRALWNAADNCFEITGKLFLPIVIWLFLAFPVLFGAGITPPKPLERTGRNDPCPCGSGKKFKRCCGRR